MNDEICEFGVVLYGWLLFALQQFGNEMSNMWC